MKRYSATRALVASGTLWLLVSPFLFAASVRAEGPSAKQSVQQMRSPAGFQISVVASEPLVRQPVAIEFDDRGRLWVIQYLQYPNPAGLKRVTVDRYSRTQYDRLPKPPPHGPRGADRITILKDDDGDGTADSAKDFVSGLNLATGLAFGHGGVFVLNVPYLLFYPDRNRDDVPDGDPEVLLTGFGMEDAHSVANSLTWGPDGWLYGCQGSTVTARIRGIEFQQGVWRYHPITREFELFCEGGGNSWGLDFDARGNLLYSTNYGGYVLLHGVQGGYYVKSFAKHGELHNPFAYGYFPHAPHKNFRGGHVTVGGIVYQGDSFPEEMRGKYIAGDLLGHGVYWHHIRPNGSTFRTEHGGELLTSSDRWFAPTDVVMGPDGSIYVSDWCDARTAHPDPDAQWDRSNGRIYRIAPTKRPNAEKVNFTEASIESLLALHSHKSQWYVRRARGELVRRAYSRALSRDARDSLADALRKQLNSANEIESLEYLWTLHAIGEFDEQTGHALLASPHASIREWVVRLLGDRGSVSTALAARLDRLAEQEASVAVRRQLACTARRIAANHGMPIIHSNIIRDLDGDDPHLPLLWWWAVEHHSIAGRDEVLRRFAKPAIWSSRLARSVLLPHLVRRYTAEQSLEGLDALNAILEASPDESARQLIWENVAAGWKEAPQKTVSASTDDKPIVLIARTHALGGQLADDWRKRPDNLVLLELAVRLDIDEARDRATHDAFSTATPVKRRVQILRLLADAADESLAEPALRAARSETNPEVRRAALNVLARLDSPDIPLSLSPLLQSKEHAVLHSAIQDLLLSREQWTLHFVGLVDSGRLPADAIALNRIRQAAVYENTQIRELLKKHWGRLQAKSTGEKLAEVRRLNNDLRAAAGRPIDGRRVFEKHCAACHSLFGKGGKIGPDLTTANRMDRDFLLVSLVDPDSVIRSRYLSVVVRTRDGRILTGLPLDRAGGAITLADSKGEKTRITADNIDTVRESPLSLMPNDLYRQLSPQELRDLFAYLQSKDGS